VVSPLPLIIPVVAVDPLPERLSDSTPELTVPLRLSLIPPSAPVVPLRLSLMPPSFPVVVPLIEPELVGTVAEVVESVAPPVPVPLALFESEAVPPLLSPQAAASASIPKAADILKPINRRVRSIRPA